tara:strand:+ start:241 stop:1116 length:876 start_codon:yes stop_codon:yes gene_type:complete
MDKSMERLSSGKRINAGSDDPAGLSMAARIKSGALTERQAASNANDVIAMVQSYSETGRVIVSVLTEMKILAQRASNQIYDVKQRFEMDNQFNALGGTWFGIAANASWNNGVTRMNTFTNSFVTRLGGGGGDNSITLTFKNWNPTDSTANQNVAGATAAAADDSNLSTARGWNFARTLANLDTPARGGSRSLSHIQSQAAASNAFTKLEQTIAGALAEVAQYDAYIKRLEHASNNASELAVEKEKGYSRIEDTNYAYETTELTRTQIITQASTAILAQANQSQQMFLELLR